MHTQVYLLVGKKCSFFGKFDVICFPVTPVLRFALLPYYRRNNATILCKTLRHFQVLAEFSFTTSEVELGYYRQRVRVQVAPRVAQRLKDFGNYEVSRKSLTCLKLKVN